MIVAVLGASPKKERYSNKAMVMLKQHGHRVIPINPGHQKIEGLTVYARLTDVPHPIDTVTVYVGPDHVGPLIPDIVQAKPRRVIMNPGAESEELVRALDQAKIEHTEACTLVMLSTGQF